MRRERVEGSRRRTYHRQPYAAEDMLIAREPNEAGLFASHPHDGRPFDTTRFRLIKGGWDHDHCYVCFAKILPGDVWWAAAPPDEVGLCLACHGELFGVEATPPSADTLRGSSERS